MSGGSSEVRHVDADGVVRVEGAGRHRWWIPLGAAVFAGVAIALAFLAGAQEPEPSPEPAGAAAPAREAVAPESPARAPRPVRAPAAARPVVEASVPPEPQQEEPVSDDPEPPPEIRTGMALFPPPGTKPIKGGIIVPEDFQLPQGYVRHYQTTDDGEQLPAILMFHPDYQPVDAQGRPVAVPKDRVVPPELVPPGMPIHVLHGSAPGEANAAP